MPDRTQEVLELRNFLIAEWGDIPVEISFRKKPDRNHPGGEARISHVVPGKTNMNSPRNAKMVSRGYLVEIDASRGGVRMIHVDRIQYMNVHGQTLIPGVSYNSPGRTQNHKLMRADGRGAHDLHNEGFSSAGLTSDDFDDMMKDLA